MRLREHQDHFRTISTPGRIIARHYRPSAKTFRKKVEQLLSLADIEIDGNRPWDIQVHNNQFYQRVLTSGSLGLGESYIDGWWDCEALDVFFYLIMRAEIGAKVKPWTEYLDSFRTKLYNFQKPSRTFQVAQHHYDIGNDLYIRMLDKRLIYSCGYWKNATTLDEAQESKLEMICKKLAIEPGMRVLDIGCGWGGTARFIAERCGAEVVGITVSKEQALLAEKLCKGLQVEIRVQDYREINEKFDRILSVGMFEHVGYKNYGIFMRIINTNLKNNGLFLLHTMGSKKSKSYCDPWFDKYIFPNGVVPSIEHIGKSVNNLFIMEDWHNVGFHYDPTLMAWYDNFTRYWHEIKKDTKYDDRFFRMWKYYLLSLAGCFRARYLQVWQIILSPFGVKGGYNSLR